MAAFWLLLVALCCGRAAALSVADYQALAAGVGTAATGSYFASQHSLWGPAMAIGVAGTAASAAARVALEKVGMAHRASHSPDALSGGEQQRGAIARALVASPALVLADEPTGALDSANSRLVVELLHRLVAEQGQTVVLVTHDPGIAAAAGRAIRMADGRIVSDIVRAESRVAAESPTP